MVEGLPLNLETGEGRLPNFEFWEGLSGNLEGAEGVTGNSLNRIAFNEGSCLQGPISPNM